jgi:PAS domain S-box-containing protein
MTLLPAYAKFVRDNYLEDLEIGYSDYLQKSNSDAKFLFNVQNRDLDKFLKAQVEEFLTALSENRGVESFRESSTLMNPDFYNQEFFFLKNFIDVFRAQDHCFRSYIFKYTDDTEKALQIIDEIDDFYFRLFAITVENFSDIFNLNISKKNKDLEALNAELEKRVEERKIEQEYTSKLLKQITDNVPALIAYTGRDLKYIFVNRQYEEWFGIDREQIVGAKVEDIVGKAAFEKALPGIQSVLEGHEQHYEAVMPYKYGGTRVVNINMIPTYKAGEVAGYFVLIADITEKHKAKELLEHSERKLKTLAESLPLMVWSRDANWNLDFVNQRWIEYSGQTLEQTKENCFSIIHPDDLSFVTNYISEKRDKGEPYSLEVRYKRASDGAYLWHLLKTIPLKDCSGKITQWIGTAANIHQQKMNELRKDDFIGIAGHELKTPLTSLKAYAELLNNEELTPTQATYISSINKQVLRLEKLVANLLDVTKINAETLTLNKEDVNWKNVLESAVETVKSASPGYVFKLAPVPDIHLIGDKEKLMQILFNILSNAVKYSKDGSEVQIEVTTDHSFLKTFIRDQGVGINQNELECVFTKFYRAQNPMSKTQGLGVGLYIAKNLAKLHYGDITLKSTPGTGSEFCLSLPIQ